MPLTELWEIYGVMAFTAFMAGTMLPMASEGVLAGLVASKPELAGGIWLAATAANTAGSAFNWAVGRYCLHWRDRRWFPIKAQHLDRASGQFNRYGMPALLFAWLPLVGDPLTFAAGMLRVRFAPFIALVAAGKGGRYAAILWGVGILS
jgi:membrane protein YqaA with SNARE-associated domain